MSIKGFRILWVKVHIDDKHIRINLPISLYAFEELLDCIMDLLELACFFAPNRPVGSSSVSVHTVKSLAYEIIRLLNSLSDQEPYDLVDVAVNNVKVSIKIR